MIPQELIERALAFTGKTPWDMQIIFTISDSKSQIVEEFSIEKFCYYLLSPSFIREHFKKYGDCASKLEYGEAIYEYQKGNEQPLIYLLSKI